MAGQREGNEENSDRGSLPLQGKASGLEETGC